MAATLTLRPTSDVTLSHNVEGTDYGYQAISESSADDDSTFIHNNSMASNTTSETTTSIFSLPYSIPDNTKITSIKLYLRMSPGNGTVSGVLSENSVYLGIVCGTEITYLEKFSSSLGFTSGTSNTIYYKTYTYDHSQTSLDSINSCKNISGLQCIIASEAVRNSASAKSFQYVKITQVYVVITYEENKPFYLKQNGAWTELAGTLYQKQNGVWVEAEPSVLTEGNYVIVDV